MTDFAHTSTERLVHYQCQVCKGWWTIGDPPARYQWTCPWCGRLLEVADKSISKPEKPIIHVYSDGSCNTADRVGGWATFITDDADLELVKAGRVMDTTSQRMELMAAITGLELAGERQSSLIVLHTDSAYVYNLSLQNYKPTLNLDLYGKLMALVRRLTPEIMQDLNSHPDEVRIVHSAANLARTAELENESN